MIDLHTHTTASDGTYSPEELVRAAVETKLDAIAITDHDTFAGYLEAVPFAEAAGLRLLCGIELSTKIASPKRTVHLLGYFLGGPPSEGFLEWICGLQWARRDRNRRLAAKLQSIGMDIKLEEVEALGRTMAGRPHFAKLMIEKGYCANRQEAFDKYLDESAPGYVDREEPPFEEGVRRIQQGGGLTSLAHPIRLGKHDHAEEEALIGQLAASGLDAMEVFHSDHTHSDIARYLSLARKYGLKITGGSDFHGENKPSVSLGRGAGNLDIPLTLLDELMQGLPQQ